MAIDPAFLFYDGDAAKDVSHLNRLERGCYFDIIQSQRKFGRLKIEVIQKVLGKDFETCWPSIELILKQEDGLYFIQWLWEATIKRQKHSEHQRNNANIRWAKKDMPTQCDGIANAMPLENENEIENVKEDKNVVFRKPTLEQVIKYCKETKSKVDPEVFWHTYESSGWIKANGRRVLNWKSTIKTWEKREHEFVKPVIKTAATVEAANETLEKMERWKRGEE